LRTLDRRAAVVTGGASGVGLGIAAVLHAEGARVAVLDIDGPSADRAAAGLGNGAVGLRADVSNAEDMTAAAAAVV
jgi:NAD(P)-dependent dehydrogenase (short-subunit alcohol dehydrogenase family)